MGKGVNIGFLNGVFGIAIVPKDAAGDAVEPAIMLLDDGAKRGLVTGERALDKARLARRDGKARRGYGSHACSPCCQLRCAWKEKVPVPGHLPIKTKPAWMAGTIRARFL